jgi:hypothetical protein
MADRVSASIVIGGSLSTSGYAELVELIGKEGLSTEWDGEPFEADHRTIGEPLSLYAHEVAWGHFGGLESWCTRNEVTFARWSGSYPGQLGPERVVHQGDGTLTSYAVTEDDTVVISREALEKLGSFAAVLAHFAAADFAVPPLVVEGDVLDAPTSSDTSSHAEGASHVE